MTILSLGQIPVGAARFDIILVDEDRQLLQIETACRFSAARKNKLDFGEIRSRQFNAAYSPGFRTAYRSASSRAVVDLHFE